MKRTLIAAAVLAAASTSAFASPLKNPFIFNATLVGEAVGIEGFVTLFGCVSVSSTAGAVVNNSQHAYANASLSPNAQSYTSGSITTRIDNSYKSINGGGNAWASVSTSHSSESYGAQGSQASAGYAYGQQSSSVKGGGYEYSAQASQIGGSFSHESQNSGGHISAGGHAGISYQASSNYNPWTNTASGHASVSGGLSAGYKESSYANQEQIGGSFGAAQGSGQGKVWGYQAKQGSGYMAYGEQSSGYEVEKSKTHDSISASWGFSSTVASTDVDVYGSVTQHINTQKAGNLTATTGSNAAQRVSGNIGVNIAEGVNNAQSNDAALASVDAGNVFGNAQVFNNQSSGGKANINNFNVNASVGDGSLQYASGNVGVNVASGISNVQNNSMAASTSTVSRNHGSAAMVATDDSSQSAGVSFHGSFEGTAMLGANALSGATGNIGVNIAGGAGNVQHNGLAIASMNTSR
ncbi:hypothetical protein [Burkholderia sp. Ac-20365]|uniref:hypothetical protein n=1 Tax=Burkholderia sp. Ac-20365 TaxID=2703897 RepID=UPI00197C4231|nr:hypothetical protein [Burkholderia sp. Ac-20365]MBN3767399.1 hypothetical protein [Burkholderia sp. Ac-20365]